MRDDDLHKSSCLNNNNVRQEFLFRRSQIFCIAPWIHLSVFPDGKIYPCCSQAHRYGPSLKGESLKEAWNSERMKALRQNMLNEKNSSWCMGCYKQEEAGIKSLRIYLNTEFAHHYDLILKTECDGHFPVFRLASVDMRFSNICNLRCRTCSPNFSTKWHQDAHRLGWTRNHKAKSLRVSKHPQIWGEFQAQLPNLEEIHFSGGEPLLMEEHYWILDDFIRMRKLDVKLVYNTNFSILEFKGKILPSLWKNFPQVVLKASLDGMNAQGEYLRKGLRWERVLENRRRVANECPSVRFLVRATVSTMNVFHILDFYRSWVEQGHISPSGMIFHPVAGPKEYNIQGLPIQVKKKVEDAYRTFMENYLSRLGEEALSAKSYFEFLLSHMLDKQFDITDEFCAITYELDSLRNESFSNTFPELCGLVKLRGREQPSSITASSQLARRRQLERTLSTFF